MSPDGLAAIASREVQLTAARMAQDAFAGILRLTLDKEVDRLQASLSELLPRCRNWCQAGGSDDARSLRMALLISGLDQWGLAYSQAFGLTGIPALTALLGALRTGLDAADDARFQQYFSRIETVESDAIDFKIELRRAIHLALWHAMAACESKDEADSILQPLGSLMVSLVNRMPELGWRLVADALASIQCRLLGDAAASDVAQDATRRLFDALRASLPAQRYQEILAHSGQAVIAWQQSRRAVH